VPSLEEALLELQLEPVHAPVRALFRDGLGSRVASGKGSAADLARLRERHAEVLRAVAAATGVNGEADALAAGSVERVGRVFGTGAPGGMLVPVERADRAAVLVWLLLARTGELARNADIPATSRAWYDELRLAPVLAAGLRELGLDEAEAWNAAELVRILLDLPRPGTLRGPAKTADARLLEAWLARDHLRAAMGVNSWKGTEWLDRDRFAAMLAWAARLDAIDEATDRGATPARGSRPWVTRLARAADAAGYRLDRLRTSVAGATPREPAPRTSAPASGGKSPSPARRTRRSPPA
jgi:hypothetical protein